MNRFLGIDTSNYTTSAAVAENNEVIKNIRRVLDVKSGERGLRQSDAVFAHTVAFPEIIKQAGAYNYSAVGCSDKPRDIEGSYMPCFFAGVSAAETAAAVLGVPIYRFSHQAGHIMAALYSCGRTDLYGEDFIAFHVSGGTTEALLVSDGEIKKLGGTLDLSAGKAIDRTGVKLGMKFPCGAELEKAAAPVLDGRAVKNVKACVKGYDCNISGVENKIDKMISSGFDAEEIAAYTIEFVKLTLYKMSANICADYPGLPVVYAGGVMSNRYIRGFLEERFDSYFADPEYSCDNAAGIALLCERRWETEHG